MADPAAAARTAEPARAPELRADPAWRAIEVLSDVHLSASMPATFDAWAAHLRHTDANAVILLGDLFEVWVGDDARHDPFEAACVEVLRQASRHRWIAFMAGNRDFLLGGETLAACGLYRLDDPTTLVAFGRRALLTHGDAWCLADGEYQAFRAEVRQSDWQRAFLDRPLEERRRLARQMRDASQAHHRAMPDVTSADIDRETALRNLRAQAAATLVHGHTHRPSHDAMADGIDRYVTSDWDFDGGAQRGDVLRLTPSGIERIAPRIRP